MSIKLHQFYPCWDLPNASPFCMKLETYLRMTKIPYEVVFEADPRKGPKGKMPFIKDNDKTIADSGIIIDYLKQQYGDTLDADLTSAQKAQALTLQRLMDEHLYWALMYSRWIEPAAWAITKKTFFAHLPAPLRLFVPELIRKKTMKQLQSHGMGRHTREEIYQLGINDLQAIASTLGTQDFLLGNKPTSVDASAYAYIANFLKAPINSPLQNFIKSQQNLTDYCTRMQARFY